LDGIGVSGNVAEMPVKEHKMNEKVIFKNHVAVLVTEKRVQNKKTKKWESKFSERPLDTLLADLQTEIELEPGTLFDDVWKYIVKEGSLYGLIFARAMGIFPIKAFIEEAKKPHKPRKNEDPNDSMHYLQAYWEADYTSWGDEPATLHISPGFHGYGRNIPKFQKDNKKESYETGYSLSFTPINEYMGYELKIDKKVTFTDMYTEKNRVEMTKGGQFKRVHGGKTPPLKTLLEGEQFWTVYDLLHAILFEMTWMGLPKHQAAEKKILDRRCKEAKIMIAKRKGKKKS
jgi:hypothetical protein